MSGAAGSVPEAPPADAALITDLDAKALKVGGFVPFSATDYPGRLAAVVFVQGCPWRCGYCHNPHLQARTEAGPLAWDAVLARLRRRAGLLDAVVFSGGEPTMDAGLAQAMRQVRALGYQVGLHTAGCYPRRLLEVLPLVDWVGLDVKAAPADYDAVTQVRASAEPVRASVRALIDSGVAFEVRTTIHPQAHSAEGLLALGEFLRAQGVRRYALQQFRATGCADAALAARQAHGQDLGAAVAPQLQRWFAHFTLREA